MKIGLVILVIVATLVIISCDAGAVFYDVRDGQYISIKSGGIATVVVDLPMDAGMEIGEGFVYYLEMIPDPNATWSDFSYQKFMKVLNNNTASIAINFDTYGKSVGECGSPYILTLIVERGTERVERVWRGGVCVSEWEDVDYIAGDIGGDSQDVMDTLNDHTDIFDMQLEPKIIKATPNEIKSFNLTIGGAEPMDGIEVSVGHGSIVIEPLTTVVSTSEEEPYQTIPFSLQAPETEGEYSFSIEGSTDSCKGSHCKKTVTGSIMVSEAPEEDTGISLTTFPENIDSRNLNPVTIRYTVKNNLPEIREFEMSVEIEPVGARNTFVEESIEIGSGQTRTKSFIFTPAEQRKIYKIRITARSGEEKASFTAVVSTDEMVSDILRERDDIWDNLSTDEQTILGNQIMDWRNEYKTADQDENLDGYSSLKETVDAARTNAQTAANDNPDWANATGFLDKEETEPDYTFIITVVMLCIGLFGAYIMYRKMSSGKQEDGDFQEVKF